jgi:branched-chain amino acid transport system substrate-binding protein
MSLPRLWRSTNKIFRSTAINKAIISQAIHRAATTLRQTTRTEGWAILLLMSVALGALGGCTPVPPVTKIGLIAPFEGLYRESGYGALAALRSALAACSPPGLDVVPLALDDSADPVRARRAAQKLLLDPDVRALIGPLDLAATIDVGQVISDVRPDGELVWIVPALVEPDGGFPASPTGDSIAALVAAIASHPEPPARLLVVGLPAGLETGDLAGDAEALPVLRIDEPAAAAAAIQPGDTVLWMSQAATAAAFQTRLADAGKRVPLWLWPGADGSIYAAHLDGLPEGASQLTWRDPADAGWSQSHEPARPNDYLVYRATCTALAAVSKTTPPPSAPWQVHPLPLDADNAAGRGTS